MSGPIPEPLARLDAIEARLAELEQRLAETGAPNGYRDTLDVREAIRGRGSA
jgi:hypothetical protein